MNPLEMPGPQFLTFYLYALAGAVVMAAALRWVLRFPYGDAEADAVDLDPYEVVYLKGGETLATHAAIASLVRRGVVTASPSGRTLSIEASLPPGLHPLEKAVAPDFKDGEFTRQVGASLRVASPLLEKTRKRLTKLGLLMHDGAAWRAQLLLQTSPILAVLLLGLAKVQVGLSRGKAVSFLVVLCVFTAIIAVYFLFMLKRPYRSRRRDRVLSNLRVENSALRLTSSRNADDLEGHDLTLALALFGTGILASGPLHNVWTSLVTPPSTSSWLSFGPRDSAWGGSGGSGWSGGGGGDWSGGGGGDWSGGGGGGGGGCGGGGGGDGGGGCGGCGGGGDN